MNLPELHQLRNDQSTYITFTKALVDFDRAITLGKACYFTKMVALNIPNWENPNFYMDLSAVGVGSTNPNLVFPKAIQYYMENIIRQTIGINETQIEEIVELSFWKLLNKMGLDAQAIKDTFTFTNEIATSNFVTTEGSNGWGEIVTQVPNKSKLLIPAWRTVNEVSDIVQCDNTDVCIFDNGLKQILFPADLKDVIDFGNLGYDELTKSSFDFNVLLLFYTDDTGIQKLHGINFIHPFENKVSYWDLEKFTQKTNEVQTVGYQFKFNLKTCNNEASQIQIYELQEHSHWNVFAETLGKLNSFLELKMRETDIGMY
jgi:hypothetical protein